MKSILQKKMLSLAFSVCTVLGIAQCPTITSITSSYGANGTVTLTALSGGTMTPTSLLLWSYGGSATYISGNNPVVVRYAANGHYNICTSYSACPSSNFCKVDSVSNVTTSTVTPCPVSVTSISAVNGANGNVTLTALNNGSISSTPTGVTWNYSPATYVSGNNPVVIHYAANGTYSICASYSTCPSSSFCSINSVSNVTPSTVTPCPTGVTSINAVNGANGNVTLTALSGGSISSTPTGVTWNYSPATYVSGNNPLVVRYTANSTYTICASYSTCPSANACVVDSISNVTTSTISPCPVLTSISSVNGANGTVTLTALSGTNTGGPMNWNYGGSATVISGNNPVIVRYAANGTYSVCASRIACPSNSVCTVSTVSNVTTSTVTSCQSNFHIFADSSNTGNYFAYNLSTGSNLSYSWNFGDGTTSNLQYPFHQYAIPGQYIVCLTVSNSTLCSSTHCDSSSVHKVASGFLMSQVNVIPQAVTGIKDINSTINVMAYPNPMTDELFIEINQKDNAKVSYKLMDALGRVVTIGTIENTKVIINTSSLQKGCYTLSILNENGTSFKTLKMIK